MDWTEILIKINVADVQAASDIACMAVPYGFYLEDYSDLEQGAREIAHIDLIDEELLQKDRNTAVIHLYIAENENPAEAIAYLRYSLVQAGIHHTIVTEEVSERDWANNWKQYFKPTPVGKRLLILPEWETAENLQGRIVLKIDPGAAFGTGTHATTRLCLQALEQALQPGDAVLDMGCGSGILSIGAMLLGAGRVTGVDIDPLAVKTAQENGRKNGLYPPEYTMVQGDLAQQVDRAFDICVANIVADVIIRLSKDAAALIRDGGTWIMSGIIEPRAQEVRDAARQAGFEIMTQAQQDGWVCLTAINRG